MSKAPNCTASISPHRERQPTINGSLTPDGVVRFFLINPGLISSL
jgi:hypothetical protein